MVAAAAAAAVAIYAENAAAENKPTLSFRHKEVYFVIRVAFIFSEEAELSRKTPLRCFYTLWGFVTFVQR